ncbi:hypothetical protein B0T25DRAFT_35250 [Lasiosphaeria hispida]|uniref:CFEM domain-containing protein n=1 Tax=Lasiosphaeria hispida TaxID=260671 RepID=A0AAJ0MJZ4_9PEZI|nr:hypothetical protein B0T25DRAFT_35250 [Lasiosphaeria hispida]
MKTILLLGTAAGAALAQDFAGQPACATACLTSAISAAGCGPSDLACQCGPTQSAIIENAVPCLISSCTNPGELSQAQSAGESRCSAFFAAATSIDNSTGTGAVTATGNNSNSAESSSIFSTGTITVPGSNLTITTPTPTVSEESSAIKPAPTSSQSDNVAAGLSAGALLAFIGAVLAL